MRRLLSVLVAAAALLPVQSAGALVAPGDHAGDVAGDPATSTAASTLSDRSAQPARSPYRHGASKLLVFVVENHSLSEMKQQMPWTYHFARRFGYANRYRAMTHPSLPNYLAIAGGATFGVTDDAAPAVHPLTGRSVFGLARRAGLSARVYAQKMPEHCATGSSGTYAVKHNPWTYFVHERSSCERFDTSMARYRHDVRHGHLPAAGMVVPDLCHDAHDCSLATADDWLRRWVRLTLSGPDFESGRLAIVVTADEDDGSQGNRVLTVLAHRHLHHLVTHAPLSHLSLCRLYTQVLGIAPLRKAAHAHSMAKAFGLHVRRH